MLTVSPERNRNDISLQPSGTAWLKRASVNAASSSVTTLTSAAVAVIRRSTTLALPPVTLTGTETSSVRTSWTGKLALVTPSSSASLTILIDFSPRRTLAAPVSKSLVPGVPTFAQLSPSVSERVRSGSATSDGTQSAGMRELRSTARSLETISSGVQRGG